jgi:hypothetical protein
VWPLRCCRRKPVDAIERNLRKHIFEASVELLRPTLAFIPQVICLQGVFRFFSVGDEEKK